MEQTRDLAIVLKAVPYQERHRVVTALTERHGKVSALARNSIQSRRFGGCLEPFVASLWHFVERPGADLYRVEETHIRRSYEGLRKDFQKLALASVFNELMLRMAPEREPCRELFVLHSNALATLEDASGDPRLHAPMLNAYLARLLFWSGSQPQLEQCLECHIPLEKLEPHEAISCLVADAGWVCTSCRGSATRHVRGREGLAFEHSLLRVTPAALRDFQAAMQLPIRSALDRMEASHLEHRGLYAFVEGLLVYHVPGFAPGSLKSLKFLDLDPQQSQPLYRAAEPDTGSLANSAPL